MLLTIVEVPVVAPYSPKTDAAVPLEITSLILLRVNVIPALLPPSHAPYKLEELPEEVSDLITFERTCTGYTDDAGPAVYNPYMTSSEVKALTVLP
jgi:hypothetical protein